MLEYEHIIIEVLQYSKGDYHDLLGFKIIFYRLKTTHIIAYFEL